MERSDETLMAAYQQGEAEAFGTLVRRHGSPLLGYLIRLCGDRHDAEDLLQETFQRVATKAHTYRNGRPFKAWLYGIASHLATDRWRWLKRRPVIAPLDDDALEAPLPDPAEHAHADDRRAAVQQALLQLAPRQRATVILVYYQGMSYPEAAESLGCSLSTVKTQMSRAMHKLAKLLPEDGIR